MQNTPHDQVSGRNESIIATRLPARHVRLIFALALPFVALAAQWLLWDYFKPYVWFLFFPVAFFCAWIGGLFGGIGATLISTLLVWYFFLPPVMSFTGKNLAASFSSAVFVFLGCLFAIFHDRLRKLMRRRDEALAAAELGRSAERLRRLAEVVEKVAAVRDLPSLMAIIRRAVRELTGADGATLVLRDNGCCHYVDEDAIGPLWKGQRYPLESCISGWVMLHAQTVAIKDIYADPRIPHAAYRPTFVKSLSMAPIGREQPVGAIGCYWATQHLATPGELELQQALADAMSVGLANLDLFKRLEDARLAAEQSAASLHESQERLQLLIDHAPAALAMFDREMGYLAVSRRWLDDYALGERDILGLSHYEVFPEITEAWKEVHRRGLAGEILYADEDRFVRADGAEQWLRWEVRPWHKSGGAIGGIVIFSEDITERVAARQEILRLNAGLERRVAERTAELSAANQELDAFAYAVSHDLRAPLRAMHGFSQALIEDFGDKLEGEARNYLGQIGIASRKMSDLIEGILALSRSTRGELRRDTVDLSALSAGILAELARTEPEREVSMDIEPRLVAFGDARMIEAVMHNLLGNAWKYTSRTSQAMIRVCSCELDGRSGFCVTDNGAGFDMAHAGQLFLPFRRLHRQDEFPGIGIGLATVQRIVHRHGGRIEARAAPGEGATFCFTLAEGGGAS
ncbi:PAS domain S-box-containing protein [Formivibrio citricus]|uniref:histidine kinase n=1 Tax=Formivibrio citricus TaxID=83765 RepID=A0A1I5D693_9NEIS|nr:ATP-binding protein [Formivibrio citricus]SFN94713.1 PAS domain S-box-containing protein [Formivibrio citricus]